MLGPGLLTPPDPQADYLGLAGFMGFLGFIQVLQGAYRVCRFCRAYRVPWFGSCKDCLRAEVRFDSLGWWARGDVEGATSAFLDVMSMKRCCRAFGVRVH